MQKLIIFLSLPFLFSFSFSPMTKTLNLKTDGDRTEFQIENATNKPIPVLISLKQRVQKIDGDEDLPSTDDFQITPPQVIVPPKDKRAVRIKWISKEKIQQEKAYRVIAEQVPLNLEDKNKKSGIQMLLKYQAALYVTKEEFESKLSISEFENKSKLSIVIQNKGLAHQYLRNTKLIFKKGKKILSVSKDDLSILEGQNVLSMSSRRFELKKLVGLDKTYEPIFTFE